MMQLVLPEGKPYQIAAITGCATLGLMTAVFLGYMVIKFINEIRDTENAKAAELARLEADLNNTNLNTQSEELKKILID